MDRWSYQRAKLNRSNEGLPMAIDVLAADAAISATRKGLEASGFSVSCADRADTLTVSVRAGPDACAECLVPKPVLQSIIGGELAAQGIQVAGVEVIYPADLNNDVG
jgi:hypothetical protein